MALPFFKPKKPKFFKITYHKKDLTLSVDDFCELSNGLCVMYEVFLQSYKLPHDTLKIESINQELDKLEISLNCKYPVEFNSYVNSRIRDFDTDIPMREQAKALAGILKIVAKD